MEQGAHIRIEDQNDETNNITTTDESIGNGEITNITRRFSNFRFVSSSGSSNSIVSEDINVADSEDNGIENQLEIGKSGNQDYKSLYEECQLKIAEQSELFQKRVIKLINDYNGVKEQYDELILSGDKHKKEYDSSIMKYERIFSEMNKEIASQKETIDIHNVDINEYEEKLKAKGLELEAQKNINQCGGIDPKRIHKPEANTELFRLKPKGSAKNILVRCENESCEQVNIELMKCSICATYVCENCNKIPIRKIKTIMEKCSTLYFICKACEECNTNEVEIESTPGTINLEKLIDRAITQKLAGSYKIINDQVKKVNGSYSGVKQSLPATTLQQQSIDFWQIMQEQKNEDLVQEKERETRALNIVIHCLTEPSVPNAVIGDKKNVDDFLAIIQQPDAKPVTITRPDKCDENKTRPIKIKFNLLSDKQLVMSSLSQLKEAPGMFRKISVTEDYTIEERAEIRKKVKETKNKTETEGQRQRRSKSVEHQKTD